MNLGRAPDGNAQVGPVHVAPVICYLMLPLHIYPAVCNVYTIAHNRLVGEGPIFGWRYTEVLPRSKYLASAAPCGLILGAGWLIRLETYAVSTEGTGMAKSVACGAKNV